MDPKSTTTLNNGVEIPVIGLGTWKITKEKEAEKAVTWAIETGYRHIDTAWVYRNEENIGKAITKHGINREEIFVTSKLWNSYHGYDKAREAIDTSLQNLDFEYVDLYLIHWPMKGFVDTWKAMEEILKEGKTRAIGVSNFTIPHLKELLRNGKIVPAVNQVEFHPFLFQKELLDYCEKKSIKIEAYCPLTRGEKLKNPILVKIAKEYNKTEAQILLRWGIQNNLIELPKSSHQSRITENFRIFDWEISDRDMYKLNNLNEGYRVSAYAWNLYVKNGSGSL